MKRTNRRSGKKKRSVKKRKTAAGGYATTRYDLEDAYRAGGNYLSLLPSDLIGSQMYVGMPGLEGYVSSPPAPPAYQRSEFPQATCAICMRRGTLGNEIQQVLDYYLCMKDYYEMVHSIPGLYHGQKVMDAEIRAYVEPRAWWNRGGQ